MYQHSFVFEKGRWLLRLAVAGRLACMVFTVLIFGKLTFDFPVDEET
jgi:hypothetical protein